MAPAEDESKPVEVVRVDDVEVKVATDPGASSEKMPPSTLHVARNEQQRENARDDVFDAEGDGRGGVVAEASMGLSQRMSMREGPMRAISDSRVPLHKSRLSAEARAGLPRADSGSNLEPLGPRHPRDSETRATPGMSTSALRLHGRASTSSTVTQNNPENRYMTRLLRSARFVPLIALKHAAEAHSVHPTEGERVVEAIVSFADVSGYTTLAEAVNNGAGSAEQGMHANLVGSTSTGLAGAERMRDALNEYLGNMIDMLTEYGADIVKFAGDAVMAVWEVNKRGPGMSSAAAAETAVRATAVCLKMAAALDKYTCQGLPEGYGGGGGIVSLHTRFSLSFYLNLSQ